jgi:hypothetical protein
VIEEWTDPRENFPPDQLVEIRIAVDQVMPGGERRHQGGPMRVTPDQAKAWEQIRELKYVTLTQEVLSFEPRPISVCLEHYQYGDFFQHVYPHPHGMSFLYGGGAENYLVKILDRFDLETFANWVIMQGGGPQIERVDYQKDGPWRHPRSV